MLPIPITTGLVIGIFLAAWAWGWIGPSCAHGGLRWLHTTPLARAFLSALPILLTPLLHRHWIRHRLAVKTPRPSFFALERVTLRGRIPWEMVYLGFYVLLGILLYSARPLYPCLPPEHVAMYVARWDKGGRPVTLEGMVAGWPEERPHRTLYVIQAQKMRVGTRTYSVQGRVLVQAPPLPVYTYGDRVRITGHLRTPPVFDAFDYRGYLARQGIYALLRADRIVPLERGHGTFFWRVLYALRKRAQGIINRTLPEPYAALANGIVLGIESHIPRDVYADFTATGTSHIIVISGFNIAIVTGLLLALFAPWLGRKGASWAAIVGIVFYVLLVGADAAVTRAGIMGGIYAFSLIQRRRGHALNSLAFSALVMASLNPLILWDMGFRLSFLATLGLILLHPLLLRRVQHRLRGMPITGWQRTFFNVLNEAVLVTLAAQLATVPLIMAVFGRVSLISLPANMLILPVQPLIMIGVGISTLVGFFSLTLARLIAWIPFLPLWWTVTVVRHLARWPYAMVQVPTLIRWPVAIYYTGLGGYVLYYYFTQIDAESRIRIPPLSLPTHALYKGIKYGAVGLGFLAFLWGSRYLANVPQLTLTADGSVWVRERGTTVEIPGNAVQELEPTAGDLWILTDFRPRSLALLQARLSLASPLLVLYSQGCWQDTQCARGLDMFLRVLQTHHVAAYGLGVRQPARVGTIRIMYPIYGNTIQPLWMQVKNTTFLLPTSLPPEVQRRLAREEIEVDVWPLPRAGDGTWPHPELLEHLHHARLLVPIDATYPPESLTLLARHPVTYYDPATDISISLGR